MSTPWRASGGCREFWGGERYTQLVEEFARRTGISSPVLVGHSFGGRVGLVMASRTPVSKLVLVDAAGVKPRRSLRYYLKVYSFKAMKAVCRMLLPEKKAQELIEARRKRSASADYAAASPRMRSILSRVVNEDPGHLMPRHSRAVRGRAAQLFEILDTR